jgi:hypothetical protein
MSWDNTTGLLSVVGDIGGNIGQIAVGNRVRITQDGLFGLESNGAAINTSSNNFRLSALDGGIYAKFGQIASWSIDADSIYVGTKTANGNFSSAGHVTLGSDGHISANQFRIDTNGNAFFKGDLTAASGTFGSTSSGHVILGNSTNPLQVKNSTTSLMNLSSGGVLTVAGFTAASSALYTGTKSSFASNNAGVYVAPDGIALGTNSPFKVNSNGVLTTSSGLIASFSIDDRDLTSNYTPTILSSSTSNSITTGSKTFAFSTSTTNWKLGDFIYARNTNVRWMFGEITALSTTSVTINVTAIRSTGTFTSWSLGVFASFETSSSPRQFSLISTNNPSYFTSSTNSVVLTTGDTPGSGGITTNIGNEPRVSVNKYLDTSSLTQIIVTASTINHSSGLSGANGVDYDMFMGSSTGDVHLRSFRDLYLKAGYSINSPASARIYVSSPNSGSVVLRNPTSLGPFFGATEVSSRIVKKNFESISQIDLKNFLDKVEMKKFNYKQNKYTVGYSFIIEDEINKQTPFISDMVYAMNGTILYEKFEHVPEFLKEYLGTEYLKQREDGKYEYSSLEYSSSALAGITLAATQLNHNRIKELEEENKKLKEEIALIKTTLGI